MWLEFIVVIAAPGHGYHPANRNINNECHKLGTCSWGMSSMCCPDRCMRKPRHLSFESFHRHGGPLTLRVSAPLLGRMLTSLACEAAAVHWEPPPLAGRGQADGQRERRMNAHACLASRSQSVRVGGGFLATALQVFSARVPFCLCVLCARLMALVGQPSCQYVTIPMRCCKFVFGAWGSRAGRYIRFIVPCC